jgi:hypothetical protein
MQADTKAVHLPSPAARDALFVRSASLCMEQPFREKPADSSYGPYQSTSSRLSLHLTARASIAASTFCQSRPSSLLQETLTDCEATDRRDMDEQCIRGSWSSTPRWCDGEALNGLRRSGLPGPLVAQWSKSPNKADAAPIPISL